MVYSVRREGEGGRLLSLLDDLPHAKLRSNQRGREVIWALLGDHVCGGRCAQYLSALEFLSWKCQTELGGTLRQDDASGRGCPPANDIYKSYDNESRGRRAGLHCSTAPVYSVRYQYVLRRLRHR